MGNNDNDMELAKPYFPQYSDVISYVKFDSQWIPQK